MPIPIPRKGETRDNFIPRCMSDPVMNKEFPDRQQRAGVCFTSWRRKHPEEKKPESDKASEERPDNE